MVDGDVVIQRITGKFLAGVARKQGARYCTVCKERTPYDRMENRRDSPWKCLQCGTMFRYG